MEHMKSEKKFMFQPTTKPKDAKNFTKMDIVHMVQDANFSIQALSKTILLNNFHCFFFFLNRKIQTKNKIVTHLNVNNYTDFLNNVQEFWNKEEKNFFWLYQSKRRPDVFQKISKENKEEIKESMVDISDILLI